MSSTLKSKSSSRRKTAGGRAAGKATRTQKTARKAKAKAKASKTKARKTAGKAKTKAKAKKKVARKARAVRYVYSFQEGKADGSRHKAELLGGKGANLAEMCRMGLPVPPGFTISTEICTWYTENDQSYPPALEEQVSKALDRVERAMGKSFGDPSDPLLLSVRSGARASMPGMMDTVLNLGLNDTTVKALAERSGSERFAMDAYRRFVQMYADVVLEVRPRSSDEHDPFEERLEALKRTRGVENDTELTAEDWRGLVRKFKQIVRQRTGRAFPEDPMEQLWGSIGAVFRSWDTPRAVAYREMNHIPDDWGTAVNVMAMVFGNLGEDSGTGVAFTRDPATGDKRFYGEFLMNAQGEDVVAGIRTPLPIEVLKERSPKAYRDLVRIQKTLEQHYREMQDLEFTIEDKKLYMLQTRTGKRTGFAAVRIAADMVREKLISKEEALARIDPEALNQLLQPVFKPDEIESARRSGRVLTKGLNAGPGAASGRIVFSAEDATAWAARDEQVILVRIETSPEDIRGMKAALGILTARGGMTSHAALVARQMGKVCVAGAGALSIDYSTRRMTVGDTTLEEGDWLSLDGNTGDVIQGGIATMPSEVHSALFGGARPESPGKTYRTFQKIMRWADQVRTMGVRTNADQPDQCEVALAYGAEGIGLCRTEHMFFGEEKIMAMREMILADNPDARQAALAKLLPLQRRDFEGIFEVMGKRPVTVRTLDPPLHEFLPQEESQIEDLARSTGVTPEDIHAKIETLHELNPMLGHRGCRLGITYPEITAMQARAVLEAACNVKARTGKAPRPEIMIPLVGTARELELQAQVVRDTAEDVFREKGTRVPFLVGTMIEIPRAAVTADEIAASAEFFSFGTNDLTQTAYGISRDDAGKFIPIYVDQGIFDSDPFANLDRGGVGKLMRTAVDLGRGVQEDLKLGICGEHGGDPRSIMVCQELGLDYVSCSPHRIPIARLAAAQAALAQKS